ncbi:MAG: hypothetical protein NZV14_11575 [Bryobacteraceae bacterium]|nr:hypothetical protein [Bryobacteraceae bacterium]MDW8378793.1 hypothetical protein [Bryobacterales bacterium]
MAKVQTLCPACARKCRSLVGQSRGIPRSVWIEECNRFFEDSGIREICRRCHEQGTGCCPPTCRRLTPHGCREKTVWCAAFVCSALLLAVEECDPATARKLKWARREVGPSEYRLFQLLTRVPSEHREPEYMLAAPKFLPGPLKLDGAKIRTQLLSLADNVLELRRRWSEQESKEQENLLAESNRPAANCL